MLLQRVARGQGEGHTRHALQAFVGHRHQHIHVIRHQVNRHAAETGNGIHQEKPPAFPHLGPDFADGIEQAGRGLVMHHSGRAHLRMLIEHDRDPFRIRGCGDREGDDQRVQLVGGCDVGQALTIGAVDDHRDALACGDGGGDHGLHAGGAGAGE
jgi:hypothetical protein